MADLKDGGLLALQRDTNLKSMTTEVTFSIFLKFSIKSEKAIPFEGTLDHTHSFTNGKVSLHNTHIV